MTLEWGPHEGNMTWDAAMKLAASKGEGWRLPTIQELVAQFDYDKCKPAEGFRRTWYWSSSPSGGDDAWGVDFDNGNVGNGSRGYVAVVRCVRWAGDVSTDRPIASSHNAFPAMAKALREAWALCESTKSEAVFIVGKRFEDAQWLHDTGQRVVDALRERDEARAELALLNKQLDINAAAHRRDVERKDEALAAETYAWSQVRAMRNEMASFNDRAREWGAELGKAMKQLAEAHETIERLKEANKKASEKVTE